MFAQGLSAHIPQVCEMRPNDINLTATTHGKNPHIHTDGGTVAAITELANVMMKMVWHKAASLMLCLHLQQLL